MSRDQSTTLYIICHFGDMLNKYQRFFFLFFLSSCSSSLLLLLQLFFTTVIFIITSDITVKNTRFTLPMSTQSMAGMSLHIFHTARGSFQLQLGSGIIFIKHCCHFTLDLCIFVRVMVNNIEIMWKTLHELTDDRHYYDSSRLVIHTKI